MTDWYYYEFILIPMGFILSAGLLIYAAIKTLKIAKEINKRFIKNIAVFMIVIFLLETLIAAAVHSFAGFLLIIPLGAVSVICSGSMLITAWKYLDRKIKTVLAAQIVTDILSSVWIVMSISGMTRELFIKINGHVP